MTDSEKGLSIHIARTAEKEKKTTRGGFNFFDLIYRAYVQNAQE